MKALYLPLASLCLLLAACDFGKNDDQVADIENPSIWVSRIFSRIENGNTLPPFPLPGATIRTILSVPSAGTDFTIHISRHGRFKPANVETSPIPGTQTLVWKIPDSLEAGEYQLRFSNGEGSSSWIDFPITTPQLLAERQSVSAMANGLAEAQRPGVKLLVDYNPLPAGINIVDGATDELSYGPTNGSEWLVYGVNADAGLTQPDAFWAVGDPVQGLTVVTNPIGPIGPIKPIGWPEGRDTSNTYYAIRDFSIPINQNNQLFDAAEEGDDGDPIEDEPQPAPVPPAPVPSTPPPPTGYGLTGDLGPCPNGINTVGIVIQLDDNTGFDWLRQETGRVLTAMGADSNVLINTESFANRDHTYSASMLLALIQNAAAGLDCDCDEVVVSVISHGKAKRDGSHVLIYKNRYPNRDADQPPNKKKAEIKTEDLMQLIAQAFHDAGRDCVPITVLLQPCYSGAALDEIPDAVERGAGGPRSNFRVMAAARDDQPAYGRWNGNGGNPEIYFLEALRHCFQDQRYDLNGDGTVSLQEAWPCLLEWVWLKSMGGSGKAQNPMKWPNP